MQNGINRKKKQSGDYWGCFRDIYLFLLIFICWKIRLKIVFFSIWVLLSFFKATKTGLENFLSGSVWNPHPGGHPLFSF